MTEQKLEVFLKKNQEVLPGLGPVLKMLYDSGALTALAEAIKLIVAKKFKKRAERKAQREFIDLLGEINLSFTADNPWITMHVQNHKEVGYSERTEVMAVDGGALVRTIILMDEHPAVDMVFLPGVDAERLNSKMLGVV